MAPEEKSLLLTSSEQPSMAGARGSCRVNATADSGPDRQPGGPRDRRLRLTVRASMFTTQCTQGGSVSSRPVLKRDVDTTANHGDEKNMHLEDNVYLFKMQ